MPPTTVPWTVDFSAPLPDAGGGMAAFAAQDQAGRGVMAIPVQAGRPPRPTPMAALVASPISGVLCPLGHALAARVGGRSAEPVVFCERPAGPSLARPSAPWTDGALVSDVLRPVARALERLHAVGVTHRAIFPANLFRAMAEAGPVVLGAAWAAPPASHQPTLFLTPGSAMCVPCGRGEGVPADDVYALGVTLAVLALGCPTGLPPALSGLDEDAVILRKLERGSAPAMLDGARLSPLLVALLRSMLAEDPDHRPTPARLLDLAAVAGRQVAVRPPRRAAVPLMVGRFAAQDARGLAFALARAPDPARGVLNDGSLTLWIRRNLLDPALAGRVEDIVVGTRVSPGGDPVAAARVRTMAAIAVLDPHAPLCWNGVSVMPDGLPTALASGDPDHVGLLTEAVRDEALPSYGAVRSAHPDAVAWRASARRLRSWLATPGWLGGIDRLRFAANPLLALTAAETGGLGAALTPADLMAALDRHAAERASSPPLTPPLAAFLAARLEARFEVDLTMAADPGPAGRAAELEVFARLQRQVKPGRLIGLAGWLAARSAPLLDQFRDPTRREALRETVIECVRDGDVDRLHAALTDPAARAADSIAAAAAAARVARIESQLAHIGAVTDARAERARRIGQEVATGVGLGALSLALVLAALR